MTSAKNCCTMTAASSSPTGAVSHQIYEQGFMNIHLIYKFHSMLLFHSRESTFLQTFWLVWKTCVLNISLASTDWSKENIEYHFFFTPFDVTDMLWSKPFLLKHFLHKDSSISEKAVRPFSKAQRNFCRTTQACVCTFKWSSLQNIFLLHHFPLQHLFALPSQVFSAALSWFLSGVSAAHTLDLAFQWFPKPAGYFQWVMTMAVQKENCRESRHA